MRPGRRPRRHRSPRLRLMQGLGILTAIAVVAVVIVFTGDTTSPTKTSPLAEPSPESVGMATMGGNGNNGNNPLTFGPPTIVGRAVASGAPHSKNQDAAGSVNSTHVALDPSGENPFTTLPGFTLKYTQEFDGNGIPPDWDAYDGVPGGETSSMAQWNSSMCEFSGGEAHFMAMGVESCGLQYYGGYQEYGAWFARMKGDDEPAGMLFSDLFLMWAANNEWPPEIDIYEDQGAGRTSTAASMFNTTDVCGTNETCLKMYEQTNGPAGVPNTGTQWHTYGLEWTPQSVKWLIDGRVIFTALASQVRSGAQQPAQPMGMVLQSQNLGGAGTPTMRETMTVDWVEQFSWNG